MLAGVPYTAPSAALFDKPKSLQPHNARLDILGCNTPVEKCSSLNFLVTNKSLRAPVTNVRSKVSRNAESFASFTAFARRVAAS
jgi:hypothetical protein